MASMWARASSAAEKRLRLQAVERVLQRQAGEVGIIRPPSAPRRSRARPWARWPAPCAASPPSVTTSSRIGSLTATAEAIGSTPSVSTSFSCSIQARMPDSSSASGSSRASSARGCGRGWRPSSRSRRRWPLGRLREAKGSGLAALGRALTRAPRYRSLAMAVVDLPDLAGRPARERRSSASTWARRPSAWRSRTSAASIASPLALIRTRQVHPGRRGAVHADGDARRRARSSIGLPVNMDGTEGPRCQSARAFARNLLRLRGPAHRLLGRAAVHRGGQPHADRRGRRHPRPAGRAGRQGGRRLDPAGRAGPAARRLSSAALPCPAESRLERRFNDRDPAWLRRRSVQRPSPSRSGISFPSSTSTAPTLPSCSIWPTASWP